MDAGLWEVVLVVVLVIVTASDVVVSGALDEGVVASVVEGGVDVDSAVVGAGALVTAALVSGTEGPGGASAVVSSMVTTGVAGAGVVSS